MTNDLRIEFAGLCLIVPREENGGTTGADVALLSARAVGGPEHSAVLLVLDHEGLRGTPHFTVTRGGSTSEYAGWFLRGDVKFVGDLGGWEAPEIDSLGKLRYIAKATKLVSEDVRPVTATVHLTHGRLESKEIAKLKIDYEWVEYDEDNMGKECRLYQEYRSEADRALWTLSCGRFPVQISFLSADGGREAVSVAKPLDEPIVISNLSAGAASSRGHFEIYYEMVDAKRRPAVVRGPSPAAGLGGDPPANPDECRPLRF
ncbi:MAG: hypothetical protein Q8L86_19320 [Vicinamibacterales bacterium]|nr:hypothetical protein [Vicinamibacterales bacterium]